MQLHLTNEKGVPIQPGMIGLFFEDINYAADGGLYAEMIEKRSFEFLDCSGTVGDYYTVHDCGYGWYPTTVCGEGRMAYVIGIPAISPRTAQSTFVHWLLLPLGRSIPPSLAAYLLS